MTAARQNPLVERVARSCARWRNGKKLAFPDFEALTETEKAAYRDQAQAALDACQAQKLLDTLREYIAAADACTEAGGDDVDAMLRFGEADKAARALVAELEVPYAV